MKAAVYYENGPPDVLKYEDVPDPQCHPKGILVRVEATAVAGIHALVDRHVSCSAASQSPPLPGRTGRGSASIPSRPAGR